MKKKKKKIILSIISFSLVIGSILCITSLTNHDSNKIYNLLSESIITKQPNIEDFISKQQKEVIQQEEITKEEVKTDIQKDNNSNNNIQGKKLTQNKTDKKHTSNNTSSVNKKTNTNTNNTSNTNKKQTNNKTTNKTANKTTTANNNVTNTKSSSKATYKQTEAKKLLSLVNNVRKENGLNEVTWNSSLESSAKVRAKETASKFSHTRPNGSKFSTALNIKYRTTGENIAAGQMSAEEVFNAWMNSEGHRKNILSSSFTQMGVAVYKDETLEFEYYWAQLFIG